MLYKERIEDIKFVALEATKKCGEQPHFFNIYS